MNQEKTKRPKQVLYNGRWVDKEFFRAFVYSDTEQKLAESHEQYEALISTGLWFDNTVQAIDAKKLKLVDAPTGEVLELKKPKARKPNNGANS